MRPKLVIAALAALAVVPLVACELLLPTVLDDGADAGATSSGGAAADCFHLVPPPAPPPERGTGGSTHVFAAMRTLTPNDAGPGAGYDLDNRCTCEVATDASCIPTSDKEFCDLDGGRDVEGNHLVGQALDTILVGTPNGTINERIAIGKLGYVIELGDYNDQPDDDQVAVGFYDSNGLGDRKDFAGGKVILQTRAPVWDGNDRWSIDCKEALRCPSEPSTWLGDGGVFPLYVATKAYVTGKQLVAYFPVIVLRITVLPLTMTKAILTADLTRMGDGYAMNGQLTGRIATDAIFDMLARLRVENGSEVRFLCGDDPAIKDFRGQICTAADIEANGQDGIGMPCNALSVAIPFTAEPAKLGFHYDVDRAPRGCPETNECAKR